MERIRRGETCGFGTEYKAKWKVSFTQTTTHVPILTAKTTDTSNRTHTHSHATNNCCRTICIQQLRKYNGISKFKAIVCQLTLSVVLRTRVLCHWLVLYGRVCVRVCDCKWMDEWLSWVELSGLTGCTIRHLFLLLPNLPSFGPFLSLFPTSLSLHLSICLSKWHTINI